MQLSQIFPINESYLSIFKYSFSFDASSAYQSGLTYVDERNFGEKLRTDFLTIHLRIYDVKFANIEPTCNS